MIWWIGLLTLALAVSWWGLRRRIEELEAEVVWYQRRNLDLTKQLAPVSGSIALPITQSCGTGGCGCAA